MKRLVFFIMVALSVNASAGSVETVLWNGTYVDGVELNAETVATFEAGNILRVYVTVPEGGANFKIVYKGAPGWNETTIPSIGNQWPWVNGGETYKDFTLTDEDITALTGKNIYIYKGENSTIERVSLFTVEAETSFVVWQGTTVAGDWANATQINISSFASAEVSDGDVLRVYVQDIATDKDSQISLHYKDSEGSWKDFSTTPMYYNPAVTTAYVDFSITGDLLSTLKAENGEKALLVRGKYYTATKVEVIKSAGYYVTLSDQYTALYLPGTANVNITRSLLAGYNTITVPFAATAKELTGSGEAKLYELTGVNTEGDVVLTFTKVDATVANKPYLIYVVSDVDVQDQSSITISELVDDWKNQTWTGSFCMQGNYKPSLSVYQVNGKACYVVSDEYTIEPTGSAATLNGMRAYIYDNASSSEVKSNITFAIDDTATGICQTINPKHVHGLTYSLSGQRLHSAQKGINIIDGKKVIIK